MADIDIEYRVTNGTPPVTSFSDSLATTRSGGPFNGPGPNNDNWMYLILGGDSPFSTPVAQATYAFGSTLSGGGGTGLGMSQIQYAANPLYTIATGICPVVAYVNSPIYKASQKFVQWTFNSTSTNGFIGIGYCNFLDLTGSGVAGNGAIVHDCYITGWFQSIWFTRRYNSGANNVNLFVPVPASAQGDVVRMGLDFTVNGQTSIISTLNGVVVNTTVDNNANRLLGPGCFPIICVPTLGAAFAADAKNFSCGVGL